MAVAHEGVADDDLQGAARRNAALAQRLLEHVVAPVQLVFIRRKRVTKSLDEAA